MRCSMVVVVSVVKVIVMGFPFGQSANGKWGPQ
jgi:hypothetical protein